MYDEKPPFAPLAPDVQKVRLETVLTETLSLMNDCPDGMSHDRTVYYGMAQGLLSALFVSGIISDLDYELRRHGLLAEYQWGNLPADEL
ncbi:hypothetical protein [Pseudomonas sp. RT6P73]